MGIDYGVDTYLVFFDLVENGMKESSRDHPVTTLDQLVSALENPQRSNVRGQRIEKILADTFFAGFVKRRLRKTDSRQ